MAVIDFTTALTHEDIMQLIRSGSASWKELVLTSMGAYALYKAVCAAFDVWRSTRSPLRNLKTPADPPHWMFGHIRTMLSCESNEVQERWVAHLGETFAIRSLFGVSHMDNFASVEVECRTLTNVSAQRYQLVTADLRANTHILFASNIFQKSAPRRRGLRRILGEGMIHAVLVV